MSQHAFLTLALLASSCTRPAPVAPCPGIARVEATPVAPPVEPTAIVFVLQGDEIWIGNDDLEPALDPADPTGQRSNPVRFAGVLKPLVRAIDLAHFASLPHTRGAVITYADVAKVRVPMGPIELVDGTAFGTQHDYYNTVGQRLADAMELAFHELRSTRARRKVLVVIGDGTDTDHDRAVPRMGELRRELDEAGITTAIFVHKGPLSDQRSLFGGWPRTQFIGNPEQLATELPRLRRRLAISAGRPRCETC